MAAAWEPDWSLFEPDDRTLGKIILKMDQVRAKLREAGDLLGLASVDQWFKEHAVAIRPLRDRLEPPFD